MPYIITTYPEPTMAPGFVGTRRAVATLEEANEALYAIVKERYASCRVGVPEEGGSVGPLPDGTVIEIRHAPLGSQADAAQWCEIYNRHHATETAR